MSGTKIGGKKAADTNKRTYGEDFYVRIGKKGGKLGRTGGFGSPNVDANGLTGRERARLAGQIGGLKSRRGKSRQVIEESKGDLNG